MNRKKILYVDMDNVLVDFPSAFRHFPEATLKKYADCLDEVPGIFAFMDPVEGAVDAYNELSEIFDTYVLSTAPWENPSAWSDKLLWIKKHLGKSAYKRLILTHHKNLNQGDFIIDDRLKNGVEKFLGQHIHFGTPQFPNWPMVVVYLRDHATPTPVSSQ